MKVAMIGHKRIPGREGGVEVVVEELSVRMTALGNEVTAYNRRTKLRKLPATYKNVKLVSIPTIERKSTDAVVYSFLASIVALFGKYDVIHYHALGPCVPLIIPHFLGIRTVVTVHGLNYKTPKWKGFGEKYIHLGEKIAVKYADEIIVLSREQQKYLKETYRRESIYIPNGVTVGPIREPYSIEEKWGLKKDGYILFVSRIVPGKGLEHLIKAYNKLKPDLPLVIAGESNYVESFLNYLRELMADNTNIKMIGYVEGEELEELYSNARLFVFPSEAEGMPMCLLEAMSFNTPCLVSDIEENKEIGKNYVRYFHVGDASDLAACMEESLKLKKLEKSREYIKQTYKWDDVVNRTLQVYRG